MTKDDGGPAFPTDALFPMKDAPRPPHGPAPDIYAFGRVGVRCVHWGAGPYNRSTREYERAWSDGPAWNSESDFSGFLPLPADASSPSVARTAGEWSDVCAVPDRTELALHVLERLPVEERMQVIAEQMAGLTDGEWSEAMTLIKRKTAEASTND